MTDQSVFQRVRRLRVRPLRLQAALGGHEHHRRVLSGCENWKRDSPFRCFQLVPSFLQSCDNTGCGGRGPDGRGALCSGNGECVCGECRCEPPYTSKPPLYDDCACRKKLDECIAPETNKVTSNVQTVETNYYLQTVQIQTLKLGKFRRTYSRKHHV